MTHSKKDHGKLLDGAVVHRYPLLIKESHLDPNRHVNHATYLELFEEARWDFVTQMGFGMEQMVKMKVGFIILEVHIRYLRELMLREQIDIETHFLTYTQRVGTLTQEMQDSKGQVRARAEMKYGIFDMDRRKLISPPDEWIQRIDGLRSKL